MNYPNNDLWTVRELSLLDGALEDMKGKNARYYPDLEYLLPIPGVCTYIFKGVLLFDDDDRTIMFEYGEDFGLSSNQVIEQLDKYDVRYTLMS